MSFWNNRRVLLTGAGGFLSKVLLKELSSRGSQITAVDRVEPTVKSPNITFLEGNVLETKFVLNTLENHNIQTCFHLAGMSSVKGCQENPIAAFEANCEATLTFLEGCRQYGKATEIVVTSSNHIYGDQSTSPTPEGSPLNGMVAYAASKTCGDVISRCYGKSYGLPVGVARITNTFGGHDPHTKHLITGTIASYACGEQPVIRGTGGDSKGFLYIDDTIAGLIALAENISEKQLAGEAFNFVPDSPIQVSEVVKRIGELMDSSLEPNVLGVSQHEDEQEYLSNAKAKDALGWSPQFSYDEGFQRAIEDYRSNASNECV